MSRDHPRWGAPRIRGELLKLGILIGETGVSKRLVRRYRAPSQTWWTFWDHHVKTTSPSILGPPTIRFQIRTFLVLAHGRRRILAHATAE
jgi:hypothetical protein